MPHSPIVGTVTVTVAETDDELLPDVGSVVDVETVAVLGRDVPFAAAASTFTVIVNVWAPAALVNVASVALTEPAAPAAGVDSVQPAGPEAETNVVPAGSGSDRLTVEASLGPLFITITV